MEQKNIKKAFNRYLEKGYEVGITYKDYRDLVDLKDAMENKDLRDPESEALYKKICETVHYIRNSKLTKKFSDRNLKYIKDHADLLPLIIADNMARQANDFYLDDRSNNSVLFECPFHDDYENSLIVMDLNNKYACRVDSCGHFDKHRNFEHTRGDTIDYVKAFNRLNMGQALELICHIYKFKVPYYNQDLIYLAAHYQEGIKSEDYGLVLEDLEQRLYDKGIYDWDRNQRVEDLYEAKQETISRIFKNENDPNFVYDAPPKSIKLIKK